MKVRRVSILCAVVLSVAALVHAAPASAEENRLLPFWGEPYPTGYVGAEPECLVLRHVRTKRGLRSVTEDRCAVVLHARD
ncbi:hypothetical protein [Lichenifustis flavocetrariae]|uniref:Secreted protein n=1 Tax=Lichenifustis flavocetrariae TaxID=2949735 RepID=A0AA41YZN6_9HYPH|nr:hypothetical protein [Lichenifustis flavocetrariae]MCW6511079.1 hypothetical protein [Lichenifustis flavocetrariae]